MGEGWEQLPSTEAGTYYRAAGNVVVAVPRPGFLQTEASARRSLAALDQIAIRAGSKQAVVVIVDRVGSQDTGSRRVWSEPRDKETRCAQALVCGTMLARAIGSFFLGLRKAAIPTKMFATLDEALTWAAKEATERGGPLE